MKVFESIQNGTASLAVVGLGYVGLPIAIAFAKQVKTLGFDIDQEKVKLYQAGIDPTNEIGNEKIQNSTLEFTTNPARLREAKLIIVAVPTPIDGNKTPDLSPVINACNLIGQNLTKGTIVVFESTVYPSVTEDICIPILEQQSNLVCGADFKVGYSPERINPGDKVMQLTNIQKIVSGIDAETVDNIAAVYEMIIQAGVYKASSIKVAEAAKVAENAQRDINIAFMNELSMVFDRMEISTKEVIEAMNTKWNALGFYPGLVGGHCISVDPYYFTYQAEMLGYHSQIIAAGRRINENMVEFVTQNIVKSLVKAKQDVKKSNLYVMGITFKENCPDTRNSKAIDVCKELLSYGVDFKVVDPMVDKSDLKREYGIDVYDINHVTEADCLIFLVAHQQFRKFQNADFSSMLRWTQQSAKPVIVDIKGMFDQRELEEQGCYYWSL